MSRSYWEDLPDPDALPRVVGRVEALARMSRHAVDHRLSSGQWRRVLPRTYLTVDSFTEPDRWRAALVFAGAGAALSGAAALRAHEVRGIAASQHVLVLVPPANRTRSTAWVRVRRTRRAIVPVRWFGARRVECSRAAADLALETPRLDDVRALIARVVQGEFCTVAELGAELDAGPRAGSAHLRTALAEIGWGAASAPEARAAHLMRRAGIRDFVQNAPVDLPNGSRRVLDFYWPQLRACLEIDSFEYHFAQREWSRTWDRHLELTTYGFSVIHRPPSALSAERRFVADIEQWLAGRAHELGVPVPCGR